MIKFVSEKILAPWITFRQMAESYLWCFFVMCLDDGAIFAKLCPSVTFSVVKYYFIEDEGREIKVLQTIVTVYRSKKI